MCVISALTHGGRTEIFVDTRQQYNTAAVQCRRTGIVHRQEARITKET